MSHTETTIVVFARDAYSRTRLFRDGVDGTGPEYGQVQIIRKTITKTLADGNIPRVLASEEAEEVLLTLDSAAAVHLIRTLATALDDSLHLRPSDRTQAGL